MSSLSRVTATGASAQSIAAVNAAASRLAAMQAQLSSGKRIQTSSDDPDGTVTALAVRSQLARSDQYAQSSSDALAWLSTADSAFSQTTSVLQSARSLAVQALNTGSNDPRSNEALASQFDGLRTTLLSLANTTYNGMPIFGGTTGGDVAYDTSGNYVGDSGSNSRMVAARVNVDVATPGPEVFGSGSDDIMARLSSIAASLRTTPPTISGSDLTAIDAAISRVSTAQAAAGTSYQQVQRLATARTSSDAQLTARYSDVTEVDFADIAVKTAAADTAYKAALQTTAMVGRVSLLDFLR